jgi:hypothetical protein
MHCERRLYGAARFELRELDFAVFVKRLKRGTAGQGRFRKLADSVNRTHIETHAIE